MNTGEWIIALLFFFWGVGIMLWGVYSYLNNPRDTPKPSRPDAPQPRGANVHQAMFMMGMMDNISGDPEGEDMMYFAAMNQAMEDEQKASEETRPETHWDDDYDD